MVNSTTVAAKLTVVDFPEYNASIWVWKICSPILIIAGTIGNVLSILVLVRKNIRRSNISTYLIILSVTDIVVLYTGLLRQWIRVIADTDVRQFSLFSCKLHTFLVYFSLDFSVWTLVAVTIERGISIWCPHGARLRCTKQVGLILSAVTALLLIALNSHFFYGLHKYTDSFNKTTYCYPISDDYRRFKSRVWPWIDLCVFCLVPFCVLICGNISIIVKVLRSRKAVNKIKPTVTLTVPGAAKEKRERTSSMTAMLLVLNAVFFMTTSPISIYIIGEEYWETENPHENAKQLLAWAFVNILQYCNNAVNFFLYCMSGSRFREELFAMFGRNNKIGVVTLGSGTQRSQSVHTLLTSTRSNQQRTVAAAPSLPATTEFHEMMTRESKPEDKT